MDGLVFADPAQLAVACAIVLVAQLVYVLLGFGMGLIAVGGLSLAGLELRDVVVLLLLVNAPVEITVATAARRTIRWRGLIPLGAGVATGVPVGTLLLRAGEPAGLLAALAVLLVVTGAVFLALPGLRRAAMGAWTAPATGLAAGLLGGLFGTAGPPLIVYYRLAHAPKATFRASLMALFGAMSILRVPAYAVAGLLTQPRLLSALAIAPVVLLGSWLGQRIHVELSEPRFRTLVSLGLVLIGALLLLRSVMG